MVISRALPSPKKTRLHTVLPPYPLPVLATREPYLHRALPDRDGGAEQPKPFGREPMIFTTRDDGGGLIYAIELPCSAHDSPSRMS